MLMLILQALYFFLPAYFANMAPVIAKRLSLPFGKPINSKVFGEHKTWRGFYAGIIVAIFITYLQKIFWNKSFFLKWSLINYKKDWLLFGFLIGLGALLGDLIKSFFKRRLNKKPGSFWFPFDQLDFVIGALLLTYLFWPIPWKIVLVLVILTPFLHLLVNIIGYKLNLKKVWW